MQKESIEIFPKLRARDLITPEILKDAVKEGLERHGNKVIQAGIPLALLILSRRIPDVETSILEQLSPSVIGTIGGALIGAGNGIRHVLRAERQIWAAVEKGEIKPEEGEAMIAKISLGAEIAREAHDGWNVGWGCGASYAWASGRRPELQDGLAFAWFFVNEVYRLLR